MYQIMGVLESQWPWMEQQLEISTADLPAGLYFIEVSGQDGRGIQRLVVN